MAKLCGVWIDHEKAHIVLLVDGKAYPSTIYSHVESHYHFSGGRRSKTTYASQEVASEQRYERRRSRHLKEFYRTVIEEIRNADRILIMGPGEARLELAKTASTSKELAARIAGCERRDKMTEHQIVSETRAFLMPQHPVSGHGGLSS